MHSLKEKLALWVKITGVNPAEDKKCYSIYFDDRLSEYDIKKMDNKIKEALSYDKTGLFAEAYLCHYFMNYIEKRDISLKEYVTNPEIKAYMEDVNLLYSELLESNAERLISEEANKAMQFYGLRSDALTVFDIAEIRTCANNCMDKNLRTIQFSCGETAKDGFKMSREIRMYKNLNALIFSAANGNVDGVSMAYIRDENEITHSYFAFVIKNGDNLYLLTDKPSFVHPLAGQYSRCPGRDMSKRIKGNLFPYDSIANIDVSDLWDSARYGTKENSSALSTFQDSVDGHMFKTIGTIESLNQSEAFWFVLMLSLIKDKFYEHELPKLVLSYTGNQIRHPSIAETAHALVVREKLPTLAMSQISFDDIEGLSFDTHYEENLKSDWNQYLINRYKDRVSENVLNITSVDEIRLLPDRQHLRDAGLQPFNIENECGTAEELAYRQKWIARYNYARSIRVLLEKDYEDNRKIIADDVRAQIESRLKEIVILVLQNKITDKTPVTHHSFDRIYDGEETIIGKIMTFNKWWDEYPSSMYRFGCMTRNGNKSDYRCALTGDAPGVVIYVSPTTVSTLCQICGCGITDLPKFIRHWSKSRHYCGNPIINNIDPVAYILEDDPFNKMDFSFSIVLSKKAYLRLCESAGVEQKKFWLDEKPLCLEADKNICCGDWKYDWNNGNLLKKKCKKCRYFQGNQQN